MPYKHICGVYQITNKITGEIYIGSSINIKERWSHHRRKISRNPLLYKAFDEYGMINFEFIVLKECNESELKFLEQMYINNLNPKYNIAKSAYSSIGVELGEETRMKMSIAGKGRIQTPEARENIRLSWARRKEEKNT